MTKQFGFAVGLRSLQVQERIYKRGVGNNIVDIGLPKTAAASTPKNSRPMFRMEYVRKCVKSSPRLWITIEDKESKGLCNAAAGVRSYVRSNQMSRSCHNH